MMISHITRKALNAKLAVLTLFAVCLVQPQAHAQEEGHFVFHSISWGMVRGQTARVSVSNPNEPSERERSGLVFVQVKLFDASGAVITTSPEIAIPPGEFRSVDLNRDDLPLADQGVGGRVQTRAQVRYRPFQLLDRTRVIGFAPSIELIDTLTGQTTLLVSHKPKEIVVVGSNLPDMPSSPALTELSITVFSGRSLIGLTNGQTLRVNAVYPGDSANPHRESARVVRGRVSLYDANGALLARSTEATISPTELHSFDFNRADIPATGESAGARVQLRVSLEAAATGPVSFTRDPRATGLLVPSLELIDNSTGRTTAVWVTTGFFEVVEPRDAR